MEDAASVAPDRPAKFFAQNPALARIVRRTMIAAGESRRMADTTRITRDPVVPAGKPIVRGARLSVEFVIGLLADGWSEADILRNHPSHARADIAYGRDALSSEKIHPSAA